MVTKALRRTPETTAPAIGDWVWLVFWRAHEMPDGTDHGTWQFISVRTVSAGKMVVVDLCGTAPPDGNNTPSGLFFAEPADVFPDRGAADAAARTRKPPVPAALPRP